MRLAFLVFVLIFSLLLALVHYFIYFTISRFEIITDQNLLQLLKILFVLLPAVFIATSFAGQKFNNTVIKSLYVVSAFWLGVLTYLVLSAILTVLTFLILAAQIDPSALLIASRFWFLLALLTSAYGLMNAHRVVVREITLAMPNWPRGWKGKTAVMFADTHLGLVRGKKFTRSVVAQIKALRPDIVFIAGDVFDGPKIDYQDSVKSLDELECPWGVYFAFGNHDEFAERSKIINALQLAKVRVLEDAFVEVEGVQVIGMNYRFNEKSAEIKEALRKIGFNPKKPSILLFHAPVNIPEIQQSGVSVVLSGHTHQGQIFPFNYIARWVYKKYHYGLHKLENMYVYTTNGVGTWGPLMRLGNRPEIVKITFT